MRISKLLEAKGGFVATIDPQATVADALVELSRNGIGALVVSTDQLHIEGIVSERDVVRQLERRGPEVLRDRVSRIMSTHVETCSPDDEVDSLMRTMTDHRIRHLPVVSGGELCGIVSIGDVVKNRIGELEDDKSALLNYIGAR